MLPTKLRCHAVTAGADSPVSRLCTARNAGVLMLCTKASNHKPVTTRLVRRHLWMSPGGFSMSRRDSDSEKVPAALYDRLRGSNVQSPALWSILKEIDPITKPIVRILASLESFLHDARGGFRTCPVIP